jgi:histidine triad (HIT) family protein
MKDDCVFCKIAKGEIKVNRIYENANFFSMLDANQEIKGHSLVISKKHFVTTLDLPPTIASELLDCIKKTAIKIMEKEKAEGFHVINNNFSAAKQVVKHVHFHIIPRKRNDMLGGELIY